MEAVVDEERGRPRGGSRSLLWRHAVVAGTGFMLGFGHTRGVVSSKARGYSSCPLGKPESAVFRGDGPCGPFVSRGKRVEKKMIQTVDRKAYNGLF